MIKPRIIMSFSSIAIFLVYLYFQRTKSWSIKYNLIKNKLKKTLLRLICMFEII